MSFADRAISPDSRHGCKGLQLLQRMLYPVDAAAARARRRRRRRSTVTLPSGQTIAGTAHLSATSSRSRLVDDAGWYRSWPTRQVKFTVDDPLDAHVAQLGEVHRRGHAQRARVSPDAAVARNRRSTIATTTHDAMHRAASRFARLPDRCRGRVLRACRGAGARSGRAPQRRQPTAGRPITATTPAAPQPADADHAGERPSAHAGVGVPDGPDAGRSRRRRSSSTASSTSRRRTTSGRSMRAPARQLWRYTYPPNQGFHIGHRGVAVYKDTVYLTTPDAHLVALDAHDGKVKWNVEIADAKQGLLVDERAAGRPQSRDRRRLRRLRQPAGHCCKSVDPETGKTQWMFYSTPPPGTPDPNSGGATGGQMWMTGTYDPELNLVFVGTGNPTPVLNGAARPGDNPWTCSIVASIPTPGSWRGDSRPRRTTRTTGTPPKCRCSSMPTFNGQPRKMLMQASRNGYFFVLDRTNGKNLLTTPFATVNWAKGIDKDGRPDSQSGQGARARRPPGRAGRRRRRRTIDRPASIPRPACFIVSAHDALRDLFLQAGARRLRLGGRGLRRARARRAARDRLPDRQDPLEPRHRRRRGGAGVLTTRHGPDVHAATQPATCSRCAPATAPRCGTPSIGRVGNSPITYELDGRQYLVVAGGSALYAWTLPEKAVPVRPRADPRSDVHKR